MIVSTRESQKTRERVLHLGISQISGGSKTSVGGYFEPEPEDECSAQFDVATTVPGPGSELAHGYGIYSQLLYGLLQGRAHRRPFHVPVQERADSKLLPSQCLMTLKEYLMDYSSEETRRVGEALIEKEIGSIPKEKVRQIVRDNLVKIEQGVRDFRF